MLEADLKVIQTRFDGHLFRSRTEARWAVFFKTAAIRYEYKKEGFDFGGRWYLPDFWLSDMRLWLEVKGDNPTTEERALCRELANQSGCGVLLAVGAPEPREQLIWFAPNSEPDDPLDGGFFYLADDRKNDGEFWLLSDNLGGLSIGPIVGPDHGKYPLVHSAAKSAYDAARSARFEHMT